MTGRTIAICAAMIACAPLALAEPYVSPSIPDGDAVGETRARGKARGRDWTTKRSTREERPGPCIRVERRTCLD